MNYATKLLLVSLIITILGLFTIYSLGSRSPKVGALLFFYRQLFWIVIGLFFLFLTYKINYQRFWEISYLLYGIVILLLILVLILGNVRLGAQRWLKFLWFNFQPSELAKLSIIIVLSRYFSQRWQIYLESEKNSFLKDVIFPSFIVGVVVFLILQQPDLGSGILIFFIYLGLLYLSKTKRTYIGLLLLIILILSPLLWRLLKDYQRDRILCFLNPNLDPLGVGYTMMQSKIAIGSGSLFGKGWLAGTQGQLRFLPEAHTDFIFATFAEEWGFLGCSLLLFLYYLFISYSLKIAYKTEETFAKFLAYGISLMFAIQIFINIAMSTGLAPVVGLPLTFFSYGGSSILISFISVGILLNINKRL
ncbi:MAG: rod shape-determining protein RodA [Candidatus Omnitrophica bacterium]|nr:rod shape-determining protein RodA [Candidatus Omnitrophota bacterium]